MLVLDHARRGVTSFWRKAYEDNLTGMAAMVAYNLMLSIFPFALIALFVAGRVLSSPQLQSSVITDLTKITGQKPTVAKATKSIAGFKLREGMPIGARVTLRGDRMWEFLDRLVSIALPRIRDFRGLAPESFDGRGNYSIGIREQIIFPEINYDDVSTIRGLDVTITTTAETDEAAFALLRGLGLPFAQPEGDR